MHRKYLYLKNQLYPECGTDDVCTFDLSVKVVSSSNPSPFVIGSSQSIEQSITIKNEGTDPAYLPILKIPIPKIVEVSKFPKGCSPLVSPK